VCPGGKIMTIQYIEPLTNAWNKMKQALFKKPFDLSKWFLVGFTAWLAYLAGGGSPGANFNWRGGGPGNWPPDVNVFELPAKAWGWLLEHVIWLYVIIIALLIAFGLIVVLTWISSRGKFMFLDNVIHDRAEIKKPWHQFERIGNSLFWWRLAFGMICFFSIIALIIVFFIWASRIYSGPEFSMSYLPLIIVGGLVFFVFIIAITLIAFLLENFVIPYMYRYEITAMEAWHKFLPVFFHSIGWFLLYWLFIIALTVAVGIGLLMACCFTCCIAGLLMIIPYIGSVVLLPITYTYRAFSVRFLAQFNSDFDFSQSAELK
jgi:hypothetical protein